MTFVITTAVVALFRRTATAAANRPSCSSSSVVSISTLGKCTSSQLRRMTTAPSQDDGSGINDKHFTIGITGSGGLIGTALRNELTSSQGNTTIDGKPIRLIKLIRGSQAEKFSNTSYGKSDTGSFMELSLTWNPKASQPQDVIDPNALKEMDALIHLSGENISTNIGLPGPLNALGIRPWTSAKKREILDSRVITTSALAKAIENLGNEESKQISFLVASGVGAYGPHFIEPNMMGVDESADTATSKGFLAEVSRQWEDATESASNNANCRIAILRNGVVLSTKGGALAKLHPIFFLGGGGIVGSGQQYFPFISAKDMVRSMIHVLQTPTLEGPINMCAPGSDDCGGCTNEEFTKAFGTVLNRPTILPLPSFAVSLLFGEMGEEVLLGGTRAVPRKLVDSGFEFLHPDVESALKSAVNE